TEIDKALQEAESRYNELKQNPADASGTKEEKNAFTRLETYKAKQANNVEEQARLREMISKRMSDDESQKLPFYLSSDDRKTDENDIKKSEVIGDDQSAKKPISE